MLDKISEIRKALQNGMPESALALTLTLPDICGQILYPNEKYVGKRYKDWLKQYIPAEAFDVNHDAALTNFNGGTDPGFPKLDAVDIYKLRCKLLHNGNDDIVTKETTMDRFIFRKIGTGDARINGYGAHYPYSSSIDRDSQTGEEFRTFEIDLDYFCEVIYKAAEKFYQDQSDKTVFYDHDIEFQ